MNTNDSVSFIRGTTPTFTISLDGASYDDLGTVLFRFKQNAVIVNVEPTIVDDVATVTLTQEETLKFNIGPVQLQLMSILGDKATEVVAKSEIVILMATETIYNGAIHNE